MNRLKLNLRMNSSVLRVTLVAILLALLSIAPSQTEAANAKRYCSGPNLVSRQFANGAAWSFCWELREHEGLRVSYAFYQPPGGVERLMLRRANLAELFVVYAPGAPRYSDVHEGLGAYALPLTTADCPVTAAPAERTLLSAIRPGSLTRAPLVCLEFGDRGVGMKYSPVSSEDPKAFVRRGQELAIWTSHQIGQYNYLMRWAFEDDGSFRPAIGATGRLQIGDTPHTHTAFWRFDFDVDGPSNTVDTFASMLNTEDGSRADTWTPITTEQQQSLEQNTFRSWRVRSNNVNAAGKPVSYEIVPQSEGIMRGPTDESFTQADLWVTRANSCEMYALRNQETNDAPSCGDNVADYVSNGEAVENTDVVVWYAGHIHHQPRTEEQVYMPIHWLSVLIQPRDFADTTP